MESFEIESGKPIVPTPVSDISSDYLGKYLRIY